MPTVLGAFSKVTPCKPDVDVVAGSYDKVLGNMSNCVHANTLVGLRMLSHLYKDGHHNATTDRKKSSTVVLTGPDGFSAMCITGNSFNLFGGGMIGSIGTTTDYTALGARDLAAISLGTGTTSAGDISMAAGHA